jgi:hypothetical protein
MRWGLRLLAGLAPLLAQGAALAADTGRAVRGRVALLRRGAAAGNFAAGDSRSCVICVHRLSPFSPETS